jgi:hypothetical protein
MTVKKPRERGSAEASRGARSGREPRSGKSTRGRGIPWPTAGWAAAVIAILVVIFFH